MTAFLPIGWAGLAVLCAVGFGVVAESFEPEAVASTLNGLTVEDIRNMRKIARVYLRGAELDRTALRARDSGPTWGGRCACGVALDQPVGGGERAL